MVIVPMCRRNLIVTIATIVIAAGDEPATGGPGQAVKSGWSSIMLVVDQALVPMFVIRDNPTLGIPEPACAGP